MISAIWRGMLLGIGAAAPIGPVNVEIARRTLRGGFAAGFALGCGAVTVDVTYAILSSLSLRPALTHPRLLQILGVAGALFLGYLGFLCFRSALRPPPETSADAKPPASGAHAGNYLTGLLMTSLNPMTLVVWFVAIPGIVGQITADPRRDLPFVCVGVFAATLAWVCGFTGTIVQLGRLGRGRLIRAADVAGGTVLLGFAAIAIWRVGHGFLS